MNNNSRSKRIVKNTLYLYIRMLFLMFISFYTSRVVLQSLGVVDYGIHNVVGGLASMFAFFRSSLANVTQRDLNMVYGRLDFNAAKQMFCLHQTIYIIITILLTIILETVGLWFLYNKLVIPPSRMTAAFWVFQFTIISLAVTILSVVYDSVLIARENMKIYSYVGIVEGIAKLIIAYGIAVSKFDKLILYAFLLLVLALIIRLFYSYYCGKHYEECHFSFRWNIKEIKRASSLVGWNTIGTLVWSINDQGINILLNMFFGPAVNAARGISSHLCNAINNFGTNFFTSVRPQLVKSYSAKDFDYLYKLFFASSKFSVFLLWFFCLPVMLCIDIVLKIWLGDVPEYTNVFTLWILAYSMVNILNNPIWSLALSVGKLKWYILIGSGVFFMAFPLSYVFLALGYSPVCVFICMFVVRTIYIGVVFLIIRQYILIPIKKYLNDVIVPVILVLGISGGLSSYINRYLEHTITNSFLMVLISWTLIVTCIYVCGIKSEEKKQIKAFINNKFRKNEKN